MMRMPARFGWREGLLIDVLYATYLGGYLLALQHAAACWQSGQRRSGRIPGGMARRTRRARLRSISASCLLSLGESTGDKDCRRTRAVEPGLCSGQATFLQ